MADTLLIIEDEELLAGELERHYVKQGWEIIRASNLQEARELLLEKTLGPLVVLSDMSLPDGNALDLLESAREQCVGGEWILLTAYGTIPDSVRALRLGAYDFLEKPCPIERLDVVVAGAARSARAQRRLRDQEQRQYRRYSPEALVGSSRAVSGVREMLRKLSKVPFTALVIEGETGTGKGLAARILHHIGARSNGPLVEVNCAALPAELLESELFGHEAGAYTGAKGRHRGLMEQANGGTLLLDEIGELGTGLQTKLLKAIEDRRFRRLGGDREIAVDVQIIAASNHDLAARVKGGAFREDLYHRLTVFRLGIPPLRTRIVDLDDLVPLFVNEFNVASGKRVSDISDRAWILMRDHNWPGNVRELRNAVERCVLLSENERLPVEWLQLGESARHESQQPAASTPAESVCFPLDGSLTLEEMEKRVILKALELAKNNVTAAASAIGITRQTLRYRIKKYGIILSD